MSIQPSTYRSSATVDQRSPFYIDSRDPRAKNQATINAFSSQIGHPVIVVDGNTGNTVIPGSGDVSLLIGGGGNGPAVIPPPETPPIPSPVAGLIFDTPTNITNSWDDAGNLTIDFTFDTGSNNNTYATQFVVTLISATIGQAIFYSSNVNRSSSSQSIVISWQDIAKAFSDIPTDLTYIYIAVADAYGHNSLEGIESAPTQYVVNISAPSINISSVNQGYQVSFTANSKATNISVEEVISNSGTPPDSGYVQSYFGNLNPATIITADLNQRWVRARFSIGNGKYGPYCNPVQVTPTPIVTVNTTPASDVTSASAYFDSQSNIVVTATAPLQNYGNSYIVKLVPSISPFQTGYFYFFPSSVVAGGPLTFSISESDIYAQFGSYYASYNGTVISVSSVGNRSNGTSIPTFTRTTDLIGVIPDISTLNVLDGYVVQFNLGNYDANYGEIYQYFINPTFLTTDPNADPPDYADMTYSGSDGITGSFEITINNLTLEGGGYTFSSGNTFNSDCVGVEITGTGIAQNTWVTAISGSGPSYTLTLSNALTGPANGNYHLQALVYSGSGPANVFLNYYNPIYVVAAYYDNYGTRSKNSLPKTVNPISPSASVIVNAVQVGSGGSIYVGSHSDSGARVVLGPSEPAPDGSQYDGIFAFDPVSNTATTSIISNPSNGGYTFETTSAKIADWTIKPTYIQNDLSAGAGSYTGLSGSNAYAFWAGSQTSKNTDGSAKFSITPTGTVVASNMNIYGGSLTIGGSNFVVDTGGNLTARSATVTGYIKATSGQFTGNVQLFGGSLYAGGTGLNSGIPSTIFNQQGIGVYPATGGATTEIVTTPIQPGGTTPGQNSVPSSSNTAITFFTNAAVIGGWTIDSSTISSGSSGSGASGRFVLNASSSSPYISITGSGSNAGSYVKLSVPTQSSYAKNAISGNYATTIFEAGGPSGPNTFIESDGTLNTNNAILKGYLIGGTKTYSTKGIIGGTFSGDGYYFDQSGAFEVGKQSAKIGYNNATIYMQGPTYTDPIDNATLNPYIRIQDNTGSYPGLTLSSVSALGNLDGSYPTTVSPGLDLTGSTPSRGFIRMIAANPNTLELHRGPAIYYNNTSPSSSSGFVGDIWLQW